MDNETQIKEYIDFLYGEILEREGSLAVIAKYTQLPMELDPNCRLYQGYIYAMVNVYKDLCEIIGQEVPRDFYPDIFGF